MRANKAWWALSLVRYFFLESVHQAFSNPQPPERIGNNLCNPMPLGNRFKRLRPPRACHGRWRTFDTTPLNGRARFVPLRFPLRKTPANRDSTLDEGCAVSGSTSAVCVESAGGTAANFPGVTTTTLAASEINYIPVVITAGAAASGQQSATATSSVTASSTSSGSSTSSTGVAAAPGGSSSTHSSMATSSSGKVSSSPTSTGSATASASGSANATAANQTHNAGVMQAVGGSGKGAMGAIAVVLAMAMTML